MGKLINEKVEEVRELFDEKVDNDYIFVWKNKIRTETRV